MNNWQTNKPDSPGIWWWCDGVSDEVKCYRVFKESGDLLEIMWHEPVSYSEGYWLKQPTPPAFIAPKPPTLVWDEIWEATYEGERRWLYRKGDRLLSMTDEGEPSATTSWDWASVNYQLIRKVSP